VYCHRRVAHQTPPVLVGFEIHHSNVLRLFVDVLSAVFDAHHHHAYTGYEYSA
jgi:hypothetical protein